MWSILPAATELNKNILILVPPCDYFFMTKRSLGLRFLEVNNGYQNKCVKRIVDALQATQEKRRD